jgi:glycosyltransferase-like protein
MKRPLRIAMLAHSTNPRGGVVHAMQLSEALVGLGHEVVLHAPDAKGEGFFRAPKCEALALSVGPAPADTFAMVEQRVKDYVAHFSRAQHRGFDIYHAQDGISGNALAALKESGLIGGFVRTVHHIDDFPDERIARLQARAIREADAWFTVSALWRGRLAETFAVNAAVCGNGVDIDRFRPDPDGLEDDLRARLGIGPGPLFLCIGGVEERKNTLNAFDAFARLLAVRPDANLVIAGGASLLDHGEYQREFRRRFVETGKAAAAARLFGVIADSDMPRLYRLASALVFASVQEGFGLCVLEAMASGVPVVVSAIEPFTSYLSAADAIWCDPFNVRSIAEAMALALNEEFVAPLRERGRVLAARFDWRSVAQAHEPVYQRVREPVHA